MTRVVTYTRVSTAKQGKSGLGLEAQQKMIEDYLTAHPSEVVGEFTEVESGRKSARPALEQAKRQCKLTGATLVIAKLDRLSRSVLFLATLMESGVDFVACDMPQANRFTIHILAAVAEQEAIAISQRTKAALAARKERGLPVGLPAVKAKLEEKGLDVSTLGLPLEAAEQGRKMGTLSSIAKANLFASETAQVVDYIKSQGVSSYRQIAMRLNDARVLTPRGKRGAWTAQAVKNLLARVEKG